MNLTGSSLTTQNSNENVTGDEEFKASKTVVLVRMSAIGDTILSARTHRWARERGYAPFLLTQSSHASLVQCMPQLAGACLFSDAGLTFLLRSRQNTPLEEVDEASFLKSLNGHTAAQPHLHPQVGSTINIIDLQSTGRSRRAIQELEKVLIRNHLTVRQFHARKLTLWRICLVVWSFFARKQQVGRTPPKWLRDRLKPVHQLQKEILEQLPDLSPQTKIPAAPSAVLEASLPAGENIDSLKATDGYIVMQLGTSFRLKSWPPEYFRQLIELILGRTNLGIVLCGGPDDCAIADYLSFTGAKRIVNLAGRTSLAETLSWVRGARYVVTGDSFASHAADLMKIPASVLFGATHPLLGFAPEGRQASVHHSGISCSPCSRHGQGECRFKNLRCLTTIKPEEVFSKIEQSLVVHNQSVDAPLPLI